MAIDKLQDKIRKLKNPSVVDFSVELAAIPPHILAVEQSPVLAYEHFAKSLLEALKGIVPAVRFSMSQFSLMGAEGLILLQRLTACAKEYDYYILLDGPDALSPQNAEMAADMLFGEACRYYFDGLVLSSYLGSDVLKPYIKRIKEAKKDVFVILRTANKSAAELQDLLTGSRLVHMAAADIVNRLADPLVSRSGYSQVAAVGPASVADILKKLRARYQHLFLLVDGYDYSNANAKNCSFAFDKLGHGAIVCSGRGILAAWNTDESDGTRYVEQAVEAAERMKKNLLRYITIL